MSDTCRQEVRERNVNPLIICDRSLLSTHLRSYQVAISIYREQCFSCILHVIRSSVSWYGDGAYSIIAHLNRHYRFSYAKVSFKLLKNAWVDKKLIFQGIKHPCCFPVERQVPLAEAIKPIHKFRQFFFTETFCAIHDSPFLKFIK